ncbi:hypothetical protein PMAYCL1PPCAC_26233, partial [Pristionchus mayeri]
EMILPKLALLLQIFMTVQSRKVTYITLGVDFENSGDEFKQLYDHFVAVQSKPRDNPDDNIDSYIVPAENLTLFAYKFAYEDSDEPRIPELLRALSKELCKFEPNRLPAHGRYWCDRDHSDQLAHVHV